MVSQGSNADSEGVPLDHDGERLEDGCDLHNHPGRFVVTDTVMMELMGSNPAFQGDIAHGESNPQFPRRNIGVSGSAVSTHMLNVLTDPLIDVDESNHGESSPRFGLGLQIAANVTAAEHESVSSDDSLSPNHAFDATKAAETSALFKAALQINSNERESSLAAARRVKDLQDFIVSKGFSLLEVEKSILSGKGISLLGNSQPQKPSKPVSPVAVSPVGPSLTKEASAAVKTTWSDVVKASPETAPNYADMVFDYFPPQQGCFVVDPPDEVLKKGIDKFNLCILGTFTKGGHPFSKVQEIAKKAWDSRGLIAVSQRSSNVYIFKFSTATGLNEVLSRGTWYFDKKPLIVRSWSSENPVGTVKSLPLWVKFSCIPDYYWTREGLSFLASAIGRPICADQITSQLNPVSFAKMCVSYNVGDPLPDVITVACFDSVSGKKTSTEVQVTYPQKPLVCSGCKSLGHLAGACPITKCVWVRNSVTRFASHLMEPRIDSFDSDRESVSLQFTVFDDPLHQAII